MSDWIKNLKVGDRVFVDGVGVFNEVRIRTVERITKTLAYLSSGDRVKLSDGKIYGAGPFSRAYVAMLTDDGLQLKWARQRAAHAIQSVKVELLTEEQCRALVCYVEKLSTPPQKDQPQC